MTGGMKGGSFLTETGCEVKVWAENDEHARVILTVDDGEVGSRFIDERRHSVRQADLRLTRNERERLIELLTDCVAL